MKEIERKYLLNGVPEIMKGKNIAISQYYIHLHNPSIRVRREDDLTYITEKYGQGLVRKEETYMVDSDLYNVFINIKIGQVIHKTRRKIPVLVDGFKLFWEIDVFHGMYSGLYVAEIEIPNEKFIIQIPDYLKNFIIKDVTTDSRYTNCNLVQLQDKSQVMELITL